MADEKTASGGLPPLAGVDGMPAEFANRPKLKMLWLKGQGKLDEKRSRFLERAMDEGAMVLDEDDWIALETLMPDIRSPSAVEVPEHVDRVMEGIRTTAIGVGGIVGSALGIPAGPGGVIVGGATGSAAGSSFIDAIENAVNTVGNKLFSKPGEEVFIGDRKGQNYTSQEIAKRAAMEGAIDGSVGAAGTFAPFLGKKLKQKLLGITPESMAIKEAGKRIGVDVFPVQVGGPIPMAYSTVLGRIPWVGGPIKHAAAKQLQQSRSFIDTLPGRISKNNLSDPTVGVQLDIAAQQGFEKTMTVLNTKQQKLKAQARKLGNFVDTTETRAAAEKWIRILEKKLVNKPDKWVLKTLENVVKLTDQGKIGIDQWDDDLVAGLRNDLDKIGKLGGEGEAAFNELLQAAKTDLSGSGTQGLRQLAMDKEWEAGLSRFESVAAKKFEMLDKTRFKSGILKLGTRNPDELVGLLTATQSPKFAFDVRGVVGPDAFKELSARYLSKNLDQATKFDKTGGKIFDAEKFAEITGLGNPKSGRFAVTKEMLRGTGVTTDMLQDLIKVSKVAAETEIPNVSTFLARRVVMAGVASGLTAALASSGPHGFVSSVALTLLARGGSKMIANPENVRLATIALDANSDQAMRRTSVLRLYRQYLEDQGIEDETVQETPAPVVQPPAQQPNQPLLPGAME